MGLLLAIGRRYVGGREKGGCTVSWQMAKVEANTLMATKNKEPHRKAYYLYLHVLLYMYVQFCIDILFFNVLKKQAM